MGRRKFTREFKVSAVKLVNEQEQNKGLRLNSKIDVAAYLSSTP